MRRIPFQAWLAALVLLSHLYVALAPANSMMNWFLSDDAFYYFKTAQNIAEGRGITFDGLGRDSGFHPLWMALLVPVFSLAKHDLILPLRIVVMIAGVLNAGTAVLLYRMARRWLAALPAAFIGLIWAFHPQIRRDVIEMGLESALSAFLLALLLYRIVTRGQDREGTPAAQADHVPDRLSARELAITGLVAALAVLARLDNIFVVFVLGAWLVVRPPYMRYLLAADAALVTLGVMWSYMTRVGFGAVYAQAADSALWMTAAALALRLGLVYLAGLYRAPAAGAKSLAAYLFKAAAVSALASVVLTGLMLALQGLGAFTGFPRLVLAYEGVFALTALLATRLLAVLLSSRGEAPSSTPAPRSSTATRSSTAARSSTASRSSSAARGLKDLVFPAGGPCPEFCWRPSLARAAAFFAPVALLLALYVGAHMAYFGTPSPVSGQIKRWWGTLPNPIYGRPVDTFTGLIGFTERGGPWSLLRNTAAQPAAVPETARLVVFGGLALALVAARRDRARRAFDRMALFPLFAGGFIQLISYTGTGYLHTRGWYWVTNMLLITLLLGLLIDLWLSLFTPQTKALRAASGAVVALCVLVVIASTVRVVDNIPPTVSAENVEYYATGARELEAATEPGARIGSTGGGVIAYFVKDRTIINLDGLMNTTGYFEALKTGHASAYLDAIGLDYIYATEYVVTHSDPYFQFQGRIEKVEDFWGSALFRWKK